jgi:hypothetical protein
LIRWVRAEGQGTRFRGFFAKFFEQWWLSSKLSSTVVSSSKSSGGVFARLHVSLDCIVVIAFLEVSQSHSFHG